MNLERLLREVDRRLQDCDEPVRREVEDALRESLARERRFAGPAATLEAERDRRVLAEQMRAAVDAIGRPASMDGALAEAVKQTSRAVELDEVAIISHEPGAGFRVVAGQGESTDLVGRLLNDPVLPALAQLRQPKSVADAEETGERAPLPSPVNPRAWVALPMVHEGERVGLLFLGRRTASGFTEEELQRARPIALATAAVLKHGHQLAQVRRYATMLEQVVDIDQRVFLGEPPEKLGQAILECACRVGGYAGGLLVQQTPRGPVVAATAGEAFQPALGRPAPIDLASTASRRLTAQRMLEVADALEVSLPAGQTQLVPLATPDSYVGCLALLEPPDERQDERLIEAYASRAAIAWRHAAAQAGRG
ncbi:MAG TPA: GAF domain-containing protein [Vicinamibacteria bacterium]|nr:GAF domain-containing protein [Vicinamibacteria bacterium]